MRLLTANPSGGIRLTKDLVGDEIPQYAILSHTWRADGDEVTFQDITNGTGSKKSGYEKIKFCAQQARLDGLKYFWVDTCCIDKANHAELSEAINSMFRWYLQAAKCYVFLSDVSQDVAQGKDEMWEQDFRKCKWFTRGWTLQELLAPRSVEFFSKEGQKLGSKSSLERHIRDVTGIPVNALQGSPLSSFTIAERLSWQASRETKKEEDEAYSLLGICDVSMPPIYGERREKAFRRLRNEIDNSLKGGYMPRSPFANSDKRFSLTELRASLSGLLGHFQSIQRRRDRTLRRSRN